MRIPGGAIALLLGVAAFASPLAAGAQAATFASGGTADLPSVGFERRVILAREAGRAGAYAIPKMIVTRAGTALVVLQDRMGGDWGKPITPMVMRSSDGGRTWSRPERTGAPLDEGGRYHVKPTGIVEDGRAGRVFVFLSRSPIRNKAGETVNERWFYTHLQRTWECGRAWFRVSSDDDGASWSAPVEITEQFRQRPHWQEWSPVHSGIQLQKGPHAGRLVVPVRCYCPDRDPSELDWTRQTNSLIYSDDSGGTWHGAERTVPQVGECSIAELSDGAIYVNQRAAPGSPKQWRLFAVSRDGGATFAERGEHEDLRDVKCHAGLTAARDSQGRHVLLFSNVPGPGGRRGLTIRASANDGRTWGNAKVVEPGNAAYSDLAVTKDGTILCVYETGKGSRKDISLARFTWGWLYRP